jgi:predicted alpha/beta hydrolase family esterase
MMEKGFINLTDIHKVMVSVFIIHGAYGNTKENWIPWLKSELEELGHEVVVPKFPTPEDQNLEKWTNVFEKYENRIGDDSIIVGHSIGAVFILSLLEKYEFASAFLVSGWLGLLGNPTFDPINKTFLVKEFDWAKIKENCEHIQMFHSDNDPYVPLEKSYMLADKLDIKINLIKGAGHFNLKAGYTKFDLLLDEIKKNL